MVEADGLELPWLEDDDARLLLRAPERYASLSAELSPLTWQTRLAARGELLREVAREEPFIRNACVRLVSRLEIEEGGAALRAHLTQLDRRREQLERKAARRLGRSTGLPLEVLLGELEQASMSAVPAPIDELETWRLARRLLPRNLPLLEVVITASERLQAFAARGLQLPPVAFLPPPSDLAGVLDAHQLATEALEALRARVLRLDLSGSVEALLWGAGRTPPPRTSRSGAEHLRAAVFWTGLATSRLISAASSLVAPLTLGPAEWRPVLEAWISAGGTRLPDPAETGLDRAPRAALLRVAMWIGAPRQAFHPAPEPRVLRSLAEQAASVGDVDPDVYALMSSARAALLRSGWSTPPDASLAELVGALSRGLPGSG